MKNNYHNERRTPIDRLCKFFKPYLKPINENTFTFMWSDNQFSLHVKIYHFKKKYYKLTTTLVDESKFFKDFIEVLEIILIPDEIEKINGRVVFHDIDKYGESFIIRKFKIKSWVDNPKNVWKI